MFLISIFYRDDYLVIYLVGSYLIGTVPEVAITKAMSSCRSSSYIKSLAAIAPVVLFIVQTNYLWNTTWATKALTKRNIISIRVCLPSTGRISW